MKTNFLFEISEIISFVLSYVNLLKPSFLDAIFRASLFRPTSTMRTGMACRWSP